MRAKLWVLVVGAVLSFCSPVLAQSTLLQAGPWTNYHVPKYGNANSGQAVVSDGGGAGGGTSYAPTVTELGLTSQGTGTPPYADAGGGPNGENFCTYDGPLDSANGYHYLCLSSNAQGGGLLSYGAAGGASAEPFQFLINGALVPPPASAVVVGTTIIQNGTDGSMLYDNSGVLGERTTTGTGSVVLSTSPALLGTPTIGGAVSGTTGLVAQSAASGTLTLPSATDTLVARNTTDTLTNKSISGSSNTITNVSLTTGVTGTLPVGNGGTGITSGTSGGVPYFSSTSTIASSAALTANSPVLGGGAGVAPKVVAGITSDGTSKITLGVAGTSVGSIGFNNATSGQITLAPVTGALGTVTLSLPAATDTLVGKATTDTLTNKTLTAPVINTGTVGTSITPSTNDGATLGTTALQWSDLFLASGGVINWANGDAAITHSTGLLNVSTGSFGRGAPVTKTADFTVGNSENWIIVNKAGTTTVTMPAAASFTGREIMMKTIQAQTVVSGSSNVVPQIGGAAGTAILAATAGKWATLVSDGTNWIIMESN